MTSNLFFMHKKNTFKYYLIIIIIGALFFIPYLGEVHLFDWDEINFAEAAREMIVTGDWLNVQVDFKPFHEKPPLFIWIQAISMLIFGVNEFAARLPNALIGIVVLLSFFKIGKKLNNERFGLIWAMVYLGSFLPHFYFKSAIIDPYFNYFMFMGIYFLTKVSFQSINSPISSNYRHLLFAGVFTALAVMTKGPVGFLLVFITWALFWFANRKSYILPLVDILIFTIVSFTPIVIWYVLIFSLTDGAIIGEFISYQIRLLTTGDAGHSQPIYYHPVVLLFGCFPETAFIFYSFKRNHKDEPRINDFKIWNILLLLVVIIIFSIVKTKIIHYSSLAYFPISFLATYGINKYLEKNEKPKTPVFITAFVGLIFSSAFFLFPLIMKNIDLYLDQVTDKFTKALLMTDVVWGNEYFIGVVYALIIIISIILMRRDLLKSIVILFAGSAIILFTFLTLIAPKIEPYTQGAPIEFYKSMEGEDVYMHVLGYKSYAHYFYTKKEEKNSMHFLGINSQDWEKWLLEGNIDKPAYFICHNKNKEKILNNRNLEVLYEKNGFVFLRRFPESK